MVLLCVAQTLLLLAQGWTIIRGEMQERQRIATLMATLMGATFFLLLWGLAPATNRQEEARGLAAWFWRDPASSDYLYAETPGHLLMLLDVGVAGVFIGTVRRTLRVPAVREREQLAFLQAVALAGSAYLLFVPTLVVLLAHVFQPWVRQFYVRLLEMLMHLLATSIMLFLIWPTRAEKHFLEEGSFAGAAAAQDGEAHEFEKVVTVEAASV